MKDFIKQIPVILYFTLACIISWLSLLPIIGVAGFLGKTAPSDNQMPLLFIAMCAGPSIAGILSIYLIDGRGGFKKLVSRLVKWKVKFRFYLIALFTAPVVTIVTFLILSLSSPKFIPVIFSSEGKWMLIIGGIAGAIMVGFFEELGWTGFAIPKLRARFNIITTGLFVGIVWGILPFPLFTIKDPSGMIPLILLLMARLLTHLPAFRILMTWVYDRTQSCF
jgi:membrane protease YdiL (CAAX protease family)